MTSELEDPFDAGAGVVVSGVLVWATTVEVRCLRHKAWPNQKRSKGGGRGRVIYNGDPETALLRAVEHIQEECDKEGAGVQFRRWLFQPADRKV